VDRFASNTLRTLACIAISIFIIIGCPLLLLIALLARMLGGTGIPGHPNPQAMNLFYGSIVAAVVLVIIGVLFIVKLAKGFVRESTTLPPPHAESLSLTAPSTPEPTAHQPSDSQNVAAPFSPASRAAIHTLVLAIAAQIAAQLALAVLGWQWALQSPLASFRPTLPIAFASGAASNLPYLLLLLSILRNPGRRAFAYSLVIPSLLILFGIFGNSATIFFFLRFTHSAASFLVLIPWALHIFILYLAWKTIRLTGIFPNPARLIVAAVVLSIYYSLLPVLVIVLNYALNYAPR
jgi:hypothetical protein